jgi:hypothetical protein
MWVNMVTLKQFARMGGKARWNGISLEARSKAMKRVRKGAKKFSTVTTQKVLDTSKHVE